MKNLPKVLGAISSSLAYFLLKTQAKAADAPILRDPSGVTQKGFKPENFPQLIITYLFTGAAILAVIYLMWGGIRYMTSKGDKQGVENARKHIISAIIGLVVVLLTFGLVQFIFTSLGADNPLSKGFALPTLQNVNNK